MLVEPIAIVRFGPDGLIVVESVFMVTRLSACDPHSGFSAPAEPFPGGAGSLRAEQRLADFVRHWAGTMVPTPFYRHPKSNLPASHTVQATPPNRVGMSRLQSESRI